MCIKCDENSEYVEHAVEMSNHEVVQLGKAGSVMGATRIVDDYFNDAGYLNDEVEKIKVAFYLDVKKIQQKAYLAGYNRGVINTHLKNDIGDATDHLIDLEKYAE